jgi:endonuclease YncB( thermonuclease family)
MFTTLKECTEENTPIFKIPSSIKKCKIIRVIDGDTVIVAMRPFFFSKTYLFRVRLLGVDADEIRTKDVFEKAQGMKIKYHLESLLKDHKIIYIQCSKFDNFGRILGNIYFDKSLMNNINIIVSDYIRHLNNDK